ncbi:uncharacterized protein J8A68_002837 [[Candida] subhashii]|uniref:Uncharacterized protein n=1 Tax=[Candida] subhashii TaxID=561895 RepID=A0A8J5UIF9_9ASCO|nr:uncharacterized protein J8A68_002837 [[Candida] subhashii]KAG7663588.1 hypothetical protein J8A68_002837 [[Candida] subhashii]
MAEVSPSSKKVDDFLSSLSELSQERLREDQQRQRNLERNINELRSKSGSISPSKSSGLGNESVYSGTNSQYASTIPDLKFSRNRPPVPVKSFNMAANDDEEDGPPLPRRPARYETDDSNPPALPRRKQEPSLDFSIDLINPIARKSTPPLPPKSKPSIAKADFIPSKAGVNPEAGGYRSFSEIEKLIKEDVAEFEGNSKTKTPPEKTIKNVNAVESKPVEADKRAPLPPRPAKKADWLTSLSNSNVNSSPSPKVNEGNNKYVMPPKKKDWLSSTLENPKTTIHHYDNLNEAKQTSSSRQNITIPPKPVKKADWLTSLSNSKFNSPSKHEEEANNMDVPFRSSPKKKDWLTSTLDNRKTTVTQQSDDLESDNKTTANLSGSPLSPKKGDWLSSLSNSKSTTSTPQSQEFLRKGVVPVVLPKPSKPQSRVNRAPEEAVRGEGKVVIPPLKPAKKPTPKSIDSTSEARVTNEEFREILQKLRSASPTRESPASPVKDEKHEHETKSSEIKEFEKKLTSLRNQSPTRTPIVKTKDETEFISKFEKLKSGAPPPLKPKPKAQIYSEQPPPEFQKRFEKIVIKAPPKPSKPNSGSLRKYEEKDSEILRSQLKRLGSVKSKPSNNNEREEIEEKSRVKETAELPFQQQLGAILSRGHTVPSLQPKGIRRTSTDVDSVKVKKADTKGSGKLTHASKARAKGPKRRLPKTMLQNSDNDIAKEQETMKHPLATTVSTIDDYKKVKKSPPPINKHTKPKEVGDLKPSRIISGEVFL